MQQAAYGQQQMVPEPYGMQGFQQPGYYGAPTSYGQQQVMPYPGQYNNLQAEEHRLKQNEHRAEMGAVGALAFAAVSLIFCFGNHQTSFIWCCKLSRLFLDAWVEASIWPFVVAFLLQYEKHEEKVDPANAHRHHVEMQVAEAAALGLGGYALYEHHEASKVHKQGKHHGHKHGRN